MKRSKLTLLLLSGCILTLTAGLAACGGTPEVPKVESGSSTTLVTDKAPDELTPENVVYAFLQKKSELKSYKVISEGSAVASLAGYQTDIHNVTFINGDDCLNQASSDSVLVKMKHQAFSKNGKVVYRNSFDGEMKVAEKDDYKKVYGFTADEVTLGGFIVNPKTVRYAELEEREGDTFTYHLRLTGDLSLKNGSAMESATSCLRLQSKAYGSLDNVPEFSDVDLRLTLKKDWTPVSYTSVCTYEARKVFWMTVEQTIVSTFYDVNAPVAIPDVEAFNGMLGTTPSEVVPEEEDDPFMQMAAAIGGAMENDALKLPVSIGLGAFGVPSALGGELSLRLREEALAAGDLGDAVTLRFGLDLSAVPIVSKLADTLTVRYPGDGVLLIQLGKKSGDAEKTVLTYSVDMGNALASREGDKSFLEQLKDAVTVTKTDTGYHLTLGGALVEKLNGSLETLISKLEEKLGETHGVLRSLLGVTFTEVVADLNGTDKVSNISLAFNGTPAENVTKGATFGVSLDIGILGGQIASPITGELALRFDPATLWTGDLFSAAKAALHLDLTAAADLLSLMGTLGMSEIPAFLGKTRAVDLYYLGDGKLTAVFANADGLPINVSEIDLKNPLPAEPSVSVEGLDLSQFTLTAGEGSLFFALGAPAVTAIANAYNELVANVLAKIKESAGPNGDMAVMFLGSWLGAEITGVELLLGNTNGFSLDFAVKGNHSGKTGIRLFALTLERKAELSEEERSSLEAGKAVSDIAAFNGKAAEYAEKLQTLIDGMDVTDAGKDGYLAKVVALQEEIDANEGAEKVKSLMPNGSYLDVMESGETRLVLTAKVYRARVEEFREKVAAITAESDDASWEALNKLYNSSAAVTQISVPAVKDSAALTAAAGEAVEEYLAKLSAHETVKAEELRALVIASEEKYRDAADMDRLTEALTELKTVFKPRYDALPAEKQALVTEYQSYYLSVYERNLDAVTKLYQTAEEAFTAAVEGGATVEQLRPVLAELAKAQEWGTGKGYWTSSSGVAAKWGEWVNSMKPSWLTGEEADSLNEKVKTFNTVNSALFKGAAAKQLAEAIREDLKAELAALQEEIGDCKTSGTGFSAKFDFTSLGLDEAKKAALLEEIHGMRYLLESVLPTAEKTAIPGDDAAFKTFVSDLKYYENNLTKYDPTSV